MQNPLRHAFKTTINLCPIKLILILKRPHQQMKIETTYKKMQALKLLHQSLYFFAISFVNLSTNRFNCNLFPSTVISFFYYVNIFHYRRTFLRIDFLLFIFSFFQYHLRLLIIYLKLICHLSISMR